MKGAWQFVPQPMCTCSSRLLPILVRTLDPLIDESRREGGCRRRQYVASQAVSLSTMHACLCWTQCTDVQTVQALAQL